MALTTAYNEKALLLQVAKGDEKAFRQLYMRWQPVLGTYIFRVIKSKELTAEIIQDVFLKIWMSRETLSEINNFKSYLFIMSRNQALNALRKIMREMKLSEEWATLSKEVVQTDIQGPEHFSILDEAIDTLSPRQKEIYLSHRHERLTYLQIAGKLGISKESVKTHLQLAIKAITKFLQSKTIVVFLVVEKISSFF